MGTKVAINTALILVTILFGFVLHKTGKPYNTALLTIHKLATIGFVIYFTLILVNFFKTTGTGTIPLLLPVLAVLFILLLLVSGALLSLDRFQPVMLLVHRVSTIAFLALTAGIFYLFMTSSFAGRKSQAANFTTFCQPLPIEPRLVN